MLGLFQRGHDLAPFLVRRPQTVDERGDRARAGGDGLGHPGQLPVERGELALQLFAMRPSRRGLEQLTRGGDDLIHQRRLQDITVNRREHFPIDLAHRPLVHVRARLRPPVVVRRARVELRPLPAMRATADVDPPDTGRTSTILRADTCSSDRSDRGGAPPVARPGARSGVRVARNLRTSDR